MYRLRQITVDLAVYCYCRRDHNDKGGYCRRQGGLRREDGDSYDCVFPTDN